MSGVSKEAHTHTHTHIYICRGLMQESMRFCHIAHSMKKN